MEHADGRRPGGSRSSASAPAAPPPPPPPLSSPRSASSAGSLGARSDAASARPPPLDVAPHETTIGKYIARFRNDAPRPREARATVGGDDFWWTLSPRYKRRLQRSPASASSASPSRSRASIFDFDASDEEEDDGPADNRASGWQGKEHDRSHPNTPGRRASQGRGSKMEEKSTGSGLYDSLDELEHRVRQELGATPSAAPSLESSWSSSLSFVDDASVTESAAESPEVVIERVRRRLGWHSASYSVRDLPPQPTGSFRPFEIVGATPLTAVGSSSSLPSLGSSLTSESLRESGSVTSPRSRQLDLEALSSPEGESRGTNPTYSPVTTAPLSTYVPSLIETPSAESASAQPSSSDQSVVDASPTFRALGDTAVDATSSASSQPKPLALQLDSAIEIPSPPSSASPLSEPDSLASIGRKPALDSRSRFALRDNVPDLRLNGNRSPSNDSDQPDGEAGTVLDDPALLPREDDVDKSDLATPTPSSTGPDASLRTPRESTPPRTTPPLPPYRARIPPMGPSSSMEQDDSPHTAAEQVLNTLVGFVVQSWGEDEQSAEGTQGETHSPGADVPTTHAYTADEAAVGCDEERQDILLSEKEDGSGRLSTSLYSIDQAGSSHASAEFHTVDVLEAAQGIDGDLSLDLVDDYAQPGESDEMALLLVARIAVFKDALRRLQAHDPAS